MVAPAASHLAISTAHAPKSHSPPPAVAAVVRQAMAAGRLVRGAPATKHVLGKMYLASFLAGGLPPGFDLAV